MRTGSRVLIHSTGEEAVLKQAPSEAEGKRLFPAVVAFVGCTFSNGSICTENDLRELLKSAENAGDTIALLSDHDWNTDNIKGYAESWRIENDQLIADFNVTEETANAILSGVYKNVSIAFSLPGYEIEEVSVVPVPAIRGAKFINESSSEMVQDEEKIEEAEGCRPEEKEVIFGESEGSEEPEEEPVLLKQAAINNNIVKNNVLLQNSLKMALNELKKAKNEALILNNKIKELKRTEEERKRREAIRSGIEDLSRELSLNTALKEKAVSFASDVLKDDQLKSFFELLECCKKPFGGARITNNGTCKTDSLEAQYLKILGKDNK